MALQYQSSLTGPEIDAALEDMAAHNSEAWAVGERDGVAVEASDITYHNNAAYYANNASAAAARAEAAVPSGTAGAVFFDRAQSLTDAQKSQVQTNIGAYAVPARNLLDNGWFTINQRKRTSASTSGAYIVDRWKVIQNLSATVNDDGSITLQPTAAGNTYFVQDFPSGTFTVGEQMTISLLVGGVVHSRRVTFRSSVGYSALVPALSDVTICPYNTGSVDRISIRLAGGTSQSVTITAIKAEWTPVSTLAIDAPPNYAEELARCQYYLYVLGGRAVNTNIGLGLRWNSSGRYLVHIPTPRMRTTPTVTVGTVSNVKASYQSTTYYAASSIGVFNASAWHDLVLYFQFATITADVANIHIASSDFITISAEL